MTQVHPNATVDPGAELGEGVIVGPNAYVMSGAVLGDGCRVEANAVIHSHVTAGSGNVFGVGCVAGGDPQDRAFRGEPTYLRIGDDNVFREYCTLHRASGEGKETIVGDRNFLMAYTHLGHNVHIHDDVTIANSCGVSGHVTVESMANLGGMTGIHQYTRIGRLAMVAGMSQIVRDVPPFMLVEARAGSQNVLDVNAVGLRRIGVKPTERIALHKACKLLFRSKLGLSGAMEVVRREVPDTVEVAELLAFLDRLRLGKNGRGDQR